MVTFGVIFPPDQAPERLLPTARAAEAAGIPQLWLWEDCFKESGLVPAAAVLAATQRLTVGIGLLPVPLRNVAITAMELATLVRMFPGRTRPGIGHGVQSWMGQVGARVDSPLTLLDEYASALRRLLAGESVTMDGRYVHLDDVTLDWPPAAAPPVLIGAQGPKTLALAGRLGDGVILTGEETPDVTARILTTVLDARPAGAGPFDVVNFGVVTVDDSPDEIVAELARFADAGATTVPVVVVTSRGGPPGGEDEIDLAAWVGDVGAQVQRRLAAGIPG